MAENDTQLRNQFKGNFLSKALARTQSTQQHSLLDTIHQRSLSMARSIEKLTPGPERFGYLKGQTRKNGKGA